WAHSIRVRRLRNMSEPFNISSATAPEILPHAAEFEEEDLEHALFNQQEKSWAEKDRSDCARDHVYDCLGDARRECAMALPSAPPSEQNQTYRRWNGHWRSRRRVDWRKERRADRRRGGRRNRLWRLQIQDAQIRKAVLTAPVIGAGRV